MSDCGPNHSLSIRASRSLKRAPEAQRTSFWNGGWSGERDLEKNLNMPSTPAPQCRRRSTWHFPALIYFLLILISRHSQLCSCQERKQWNCNVEKTRPLLFELDISAQRASGSHLLPDRRCFQDNHAWSQGSWTLLALLFPQWPHGSQLPEESSITGHFIW